MSNLLGFFVKRVSILYAVALVICLIAKEQRLSMVIALTIGVLFSVSRFAVLEFVMKLLGSGITKGQASLISIVIYLLNLVIIGITVVFAMQFGVYTFLAALIGSLSILIIVMINAVTEAFGISKNKFGQKVK